MRLSRSLLVAIVVLAGAVPAQSWSNPVQVPAPAPSALGGSFAHLGDVDPLPSVQRLVVAVGDPVNNSNQTLNLNNVRFLLAATGQPASAPGTIYGPANSGYGTSLARTADLNGDGVADLLVGAPLQDAERGAVYLVSGATGLLLPLAGNPILGPAAGDRFGWSLAWIGNVSATTGPGEFIVGAPLHDGNGADSGLVRIHRGDTLAQVHSMTGTGAGRRFGYAVAGGARVDGDAVLDYCVGAPGNVSTPGTVTIHSGITNAPIGTLNGQVQGSKFGHSVAFVGDCNCDNRDDLVVGSPGFVAGANGRIAVYRGENAVSSASLLFERLGTKAGVALGWSVSRAGDVTGDGLPDIVVGEGDHQGAGAPAGTGLEMQVIRGSTSSLGLWSGSLPPALQCRQHMTVSEKPQAPGSTSSDVLYAGISETGTLWNCGSAGGPGSEAGAFSSAAGIAISQHPQTQTACLGQLVTFTVAATAPGQTLSYQWHHAAAAGGPGAPLAGATTPALAVNVQGAAQAGEYWCVIVATGTAGCQSVVSGRATLTVITNVLQFASHPQTTDVCLGDPVTLSAFASGNPPPSYQWRKGGVNIAGATSNVYTINSVSLADSGTYDVVAANGTCPTQTSQPAVLTVHNGFTLLLSQELGPGSLVVKNRCGEVGHTYFTAFSFDLLNAGSPPGCGGFGVQPPGCGWWFGLAIPIDVLITEWDWGHDPLHPLHAFLFGSLDGAGRSTQSLPPGTMPPNFAGVSLWGVTLQISPVPGSEVPTGASNVAVVTF